MLPYVQMLIRHDDFSEAGRQFSQLEELVANAKQAASPALKQTVTALKARLLVQSGQQEQAVKLLEGMLPRPLPPSQLHLLLDVARLLEELNLNDAAEKLLSEYISQEPRGVVDMAAFAGRRGDVTKAFSLLDQGRKARPINDILTVGLDTLRRNPEQASKERFASLHAWAEAALENEANPLPIKLFQAEIYDLEGRQADAVKIYREALTAKESNPMQRAIVENNLAFILATTKADGAEALKLADEAMHIVGPTADLLDTRALAYLAQGKTDQALDDLQLATADSPSGSKFFHLAQAEKQANHLDAAREALAKAQKAGVALGQFSPTERRLYSQLVDELK